MLLATINPNSTKTIFVENPLSALAVLSTYPNDYLPASRSSSTEFSAITNAHANIKVSIVHKTKDNKVIHLYTKEEILTLIESNQKGEGVISVQDNSANISALRGVLTIGQDGSIPFNNDETLEITVDNKGEATISLYDIETPQLSPYFIQLNSQTIQGDRKTKSFDLTDVVELSIPWSAIHANTELTLTASNGVTCRYGKEELLCIDSLTNDAVYATPQGYIHRGTTLVLDVSDFVNLRWDRDTTSSITFLSKERIVIDNVKEVQQKNETLIDTTENKLTNEITNKLN